MKTTIIRPPCYDSKQSNKHETQQLYSTQPYKMLIFKSTVQFKLFNLKQDEKGIRLLKCGLASLQFPGLTV